MDGAQGHPPAESPAQEAALPFLELTDLVKVVGLDVLGTVEHIGGETSSEDDDDTDDDDEDTDTHDVYHHHHRHLYTDSEMRDDLPMHNIDNDANHIQLIRSYEDDTELSDDERHLGSGTQVDGTTPIDQHDEDDDNDVEYHDPEQDDEEEPDVPVGSALVTRIDNGEDIVVSVNELEVLDRVFAPGQMVLSAVAGDSNLQTGAVHGLKKTLLVRRVAGWDPNVSDGDDAVFELPAERVSFFSDVRVDSYVVSRNWLGIVEFVHVEVFVDFQDGSIAVVPGHPERLIPDDPRVSARPNPDSEGFFFPGMRVKASPRVWREASWLRGKFRRQRTGIVRSTKTTSVGVQWIAVRQNVDTPGNAAPDSPPDVVPYSEVRSLDAYRSLWWRAGDRALLGPEQSQDDDQWVEAVPNVPAPTPRDERFISRPRSARRHPPRGNGRLIAAHRRARELTVQDDTDSSPASALASDPIAVVQIVGTRTSVSVLWQNGVMEDDIPSINLRVNEHPGASDFWPGMIVSRASENSGGPINNAEEDPGPYLGGAVSARDLQRPGALDIGAFPSPENHSNENTGIVIRAMLDERTAVVRWQKPDSRDYFSEEEELSVYDLVARADYDMQLGDTVLLIKKDESNSGSSSSEPKWIGQITGKGVGDIEVRWLGGEISRITPDQVLVVGDDDELEEDSAGSEENDDSGMPLDAIDLPGPQNVADQAFRDNWGLDESVSGTLTEAINSELGIVFGVSSRMSRIVFSKAVDAEESAEPLREAIQASSGMLKNIDSDTLTIQQVRQFVHAVGVRVLTGCVGRLNETKSAEQGAEWPHPSWNELKAKVREGVIRFIESTGKNLSTLDNEENALSAANAVTSKENANAKPAEVELSPVQDTEPMDTSADRQQESDNSSLNAKNVDEELAPRFEIVEDLEHHHFANRSSTAFSHTRISGFANIVRKEWTRLRKNLPEGIYVHGSEQRQDLLRVAIVGPSDTPYEDVLFYFDIVLPNMYPAEPPRVYFWSHGRRLNPNLYEDGKVCLSILGTWDGDDVEQWDPRNSNVLRVLLSLQAMVFVEQPYYNEAGYQKQRGSVEGRTNARTYNESTMLLCLKHLIQSVRGGGTPPDFVDIQRKHYIRRKEVIVNRLKKLCGENDKPQSEESAVHGRSGVTNGSTGPNEQYTSRGFKRSLAELVPRVEDVLDKLQVKQ